LVLLKIVENFTSTIPKINFQYIIKFKSHLTNQIYKFGFGLKFIFNKNVLDNKDISVTCINIGLNNNLLIIVDEDMKVIKNIMI